MSRRRTDYPSQAYLKSVLSYDPETGKFVWLKHSNPLSVGKYAGMLNNYRKITILGRTYGAHKLAWLYMHGTIPRTIDHINGNTDDNRICNLRPATDSQNCANSRKPENNTSGAKGVTVLKDGFKASVKCNGVTHDLGKHETFDEAKAAYITGATKHFGEFAHDGEKPRYLTRKIKTDHIRSKRMKQKIRADMVEPTKPQTGGYIHPRCARKLAAIARGEAFVKRIEDAVAKKTQREVEQIMKYKHLWTKDGK